LAVSRALSGRALRTWKAGLLSSVNDTSKRCSRRFEEGVHDRIEMITSMGQFNIGGDWAPG
jgi:hypothetical protein